MHIVLGLLGTIVTILVLLNRLAEAGIDLGGLNPYLWNRRRKWKKQFNGDPVYKIDNPMELTALLMVAAAKCDGDISSEEKKLILELFGKEFHLSKRDASGLMLSSVYLFNDGSALNNNLTKIIEPGRDKFTREQADSAIVLIEKVVATDNPTSEIKIQLLNSIKAELTKRSSSPAKWS